MYCIAQHIAVNFFVCNEVRKAKPSCNPEELIITALTTYSPDFRGFKIKQKLNADNYCRSLNVKLAFFTVFVLTQQTGFSARWCCSFSANESSCSV